MTDAVAERTVSIELLLAAWRDAQRALDELAPDDPHRGAAEARVAAERAAFQARVETIDDASLRGIPIGAR